jgi:hypothetical protein
MNLATGDGLVLAAGEVHDPAVVLEPRVELPPVREYVAPDDQPFE